MTLICTVVVSASGTPTELRGAHPKTPEEMAAAAKKYNMTVEDYKPYTDDGDGWVLLRNSTMTI